MGRSEMREYRAHGCPQGLRAVLAGSIEHTLAMWAIQAMSTRCLAVRSSVGRDPSIARVVPIVKSPTRRQGIAVLIHSTIERMDISRFVHVAVSLSKVVAGRGRTTMVTTLIRDEVNSLATLGLLFGVRRFRMREIRLRHRALGNRTIEASPFGDTSAHPRRRAGSVAGTIVQARRL